MEHTSYALSNSLLHEDDDFEEKKLISSDYTDQLAIKEDPSSLACQRESDARNGNERNQL